MCKTVAYNCNEHCQHIQLCSAFSLVRVHISVTTPSPPPPRPRQTDSDPFSNRNRLVEIITNLERVCLHVSGVRAESDHTLNVQSLPPIPINPSPQVHHSF